MKIKSEFISTHIPTNIIPISPDISGRRFTILSKTDIHIPGYNIDIQLYPGYITNLCSTPRFLHPIMPPNGWYWQEAIVHDFLMDHKDKYNLTYREIDKILMYIISINKNVKTYKKLLIKYAINLVGYGSLWYRYIGKHIYKVPPKYV